MKRRSQWKICQTGIWLALLCAGCQDPRGPVTINSDDPDLKINAIQQDVCNQDKKDLPALVENLDCDDAAIRFYSIQALRRLTHDDFGYRYYETEENRAPAFELWKKWLKQQK
jgi:hypothetical protein